MAKANNDAVVLARHINGFLNEHENSQEDRSSHTLKNYHDAMTLYLGFLEKELGIHPKGLVPGCFGREYIEQWLSWLTEVRECAPTTCNNRLASIRAFLKYLGGKDVSLLYLFGNASGIKRRKVLRKKVKGISKSAVEALFSAIDPSTKAGRRDIALIVFMYGTATRIDEALSLTVEHLHLDASKPYATVIGKGGKVRSLYLLPKAVAHLRRHLEEFHGENPEQSSYVFFSRNGGVRTKMSQAAVSKQLKKHAAVAHSICSEVPFDLHAHQLRHAKASHWLEDGMNIVQISFLLGHEQLQTTMVYLDITTEHEAKALATLEGEDEKRVSKKWKAGNNGLADFCGVKPLRA
jgi:site-specific recombinase XerD